MKTLLIAMVLMAGCYQVSDLDDFEVVSEANKEEVRFGFCETLETCTETDCQRLAYFDFCCDKTDMIFDFCWSDRGACTGEESIPASCFQQVSRALQESASEL